jgi:AraC-like DNA-binding protein
MNDIIHLKSISDLCRFLNIGPTKHPLIAVIDLCKLADQYAGEIRIRTDFYSIMFKNYCRNQMRYGRRTLDFQDGNLVCIAPGQMISIDNDIDIRDDMLGWGVYFHPDLIRGTSLGTAIRDFTYFGYDTAEALHLSDKEKNTLHEIVGKLQHELNENIDDFSSRIITAHLDLLLNYTQRCYGRQFITRSQSHRDVLEQVEKILSDYITQHDEQIKNLPTVKFLAEQVNLSTGYLSDLLKKETGLSAQDHIHRSIIEEAKNQLRQTNKSVSEVAYDLGFEYPQYFSRLFRRKTGLSPVEYRSQD